MQDQNSPQNANLGSAQSAAAGNGGAAGASSGAAKTDVSGGDGGAKVSVQSSTRPGVAPKITKTEVQPMVSKEEYIRKIGEKIRSSENILVALSRNPSVDEMSAAIGLTLFLDDLQKHTTAIYSGKTPDALEFLRPDATFETNTASLQDFIIALNKEKADHLRYKLEGDFVKVFITPYKTTITEKDLEFSHGDYNVDLVLALNVPTAADLDEALSEHGRIMHNATAVDITVGTPGRFGEIEWSDPAASSVSEMVADLIFDLKGKDATLDKEIATALLTGIVAATQRFSNDRTSATALELASKLMSLGADQQLISANVLDNKIEAVPAPVDLAPTTDASNLAVDHTAETTDGVPAEGAQEAVGTTEMTGMDQAMTQPMAQPMTEVAGMVQPAMDAAAVQGGAPMNPAASVAQGLDATVTMMPPEPPKDYAQMMAEALATADMPVEAPPTVMPETVAQNLPSAEQLAGQAVQGGQMLSGQIPSEQMPSGQVPRDMMQAPEQAQIGQMNNNMAVPIEQMMPEGGLLMPPENGVVGATGAGAGVQMTGPSADVQMTGSSAGTPLTGPELNPPVLPEVQVPVDLPELPKQAPDNATPPNQSSAFQIPGM